MALIRNNQVRFLIIPLRIGVIKLSPGYNDVKDSEWAEARLMVSEHLKDDRITELGVEVKKGKEGAPDTVEGKPYHKFEFVKAKEIVEGTFFIPQLEAWRDSCPDQSLRVVLMNQIDRVNKEAMEPKTRSEG